MHYDRHFREIREACGLTQAEVCEVIRQSESFLSRLETGVGVIKVPILVRLARVYHCHPLDFLTFHGFPLPRILREWHCPTCGSPTRVPEEG